MTNFPAAARATARVCSAIRPTVRGSVVSWPCMTIAAESPTRMASTLRARDQPGRPGIVGGDDGDLAPLRFEAGEIMDGVIGPRERGIDRVERIPFERRQVGGDRCGVAASERSGQRAAAIGDEVPRRLREKRVRGRRRDSEAPSSSSNSFSQSMVEKLPAITQSAW